MPKQITTTKDLHGREAPKNEMWLEGENKAYEPPLTKLTDILERRLRPDEVAHVKQLGYSIGSVGSSLADALLLARLTPADLDRLIEKAPEVDTYLNLKRVQYKYKLMEIVSNQAIENKDVKAATKLLETQYAEEFDPSIKKELAKANRGAEEDIMEMAVLMIRRGGAHSVPINPRAGDPKDFDNLVKYKEVKEVLK